MHIGIQKRCQSSIPLQGTAALHILPIGGMYGGNFKTTANFLILSHGPAFETQFDIQSQGPKSMHILQTRGICEEILAIFQGLLCGPTFET